MKKALVMSMILCVGSLAHAGLIYTINGGPVLPTATGPVTIDATVDGGVSYALEITTTGDLVIDLSGAAFPGAGTTWMFGNGVSGTPTDTFVRITGGAFMAVAPGTVAFTGVVVNGKCGEILLNDLTSGESVLTSGPICPEPFSIALLGLGGLFLRLRR